MAEHHIIVFDGVCNLCNGSVNFIIARDPREVFVFTPIESLYAQELLIGLELEGIGEESFVLVKNGEAWLRSDAALQISREMSGLWPLLYGLRFVPSPLRDFIYNQVARNRYRLFGRKPSCMVPSAALKRRFIMDEKRSMK